jgi:hypothetical protein
MDEKVGLKRDPKKNKGYVEGLKLFIVFEYWYKRRRRLRSELAVDEALKMVVGESSGNKGFYSKSMLLSVSIH